MFFFLGGLYEVGVEVVLDRHGGGSDFITIFHVLQSSLQSMVVALCSKTLSLWRATEGEYGGIPRDVADESLILLKI